MTWHAQRGPTVLAGSEARMFAEAIKEICEEIRCSSGGQGCTLTLGPDAFNRMTCTQQAASIELVAGALFRETPVPSPLTAWKETTLAAILQVVRCWIVYEIDEGVSNKVRDLVASLSNPEVTPKKDDWNSHHEWEFTFDCYQDQFFWDRDFEDEGLLDIEPETSQGMNSILGIDDDYHTTIPPDLKSDQRLDECLQRIANVIEKFF